jgi:hypothetical protein
MSNKNKDLPAAPVQFKTQLGQDVILAGFTKQERVALALFESIFNDPEFKFDTSDHYIAKSYEIAEKFCSYLENKEESKIMPV